MEEKREEERSAPPLDSPTAPPFKTETALLLELPLLSPSPPFPFSLWYQYTKQKKRLSQKVTALVKRGEEEETKRESL